MMRTQRKNSPKIKTAANIISKTIATRRNIGVTKIPQNQHHEQPTNQSSWQSCRKRRQGNQHSPKQRREANNSSKINEPDLHRSLHNTWSKCKERSTPGPTKREIKTGRFKVSTGLPGIDRPKQLRENNQNSCCFREHSSS